MSFLGFLSKDAIEKKCVLFDFLLKCVLKMHLTGSCDHSERWHKLRCLILIWLQLDNMNLSLCEPLRQCFSTTKHRKQMYMQKIKLYLENPSQSSLWISMAIQHYPTEFSSEQPLPPFMSSLLVCSIIMLTRKGLIFRKKVFLSSFFDHHLAKRCRKRRVMAYNVSSFHNTTKIPAKRLFIFKKKTNLWLTHFCKNLDEIT